MTIILTSDGGKCQYRCMKTKDLVKGVAYSKLKHSSSYWGVVVTTEKLYSFPKYSPDTSLYSGTGILVLVSRPPIGKGKYGTKEDAAAAVKKMGTPSHGSIKQLIEDHRLHKRGLGFEIWQPRQFEGTVEDVEAARKAEREYDLNLSRERAATETELREQFERLQNSLGFKGHAYFDMSKGSGSMSVEGWRQMMDRVEALIQTAGPLSQGSL